MILPHRSMSQAGRGWTGIAFAIAFVLLAVYLRTVTGIGGGLE